MNTPDLNCDLGEHESPDTTAELMKWIDSANIACGVHAGDAASIQHCIDLALRHGVRIGAHPGMAEEGGRGPRVPSVQEFINLLNAQVLPFRQQVIAQGGTLHHVKLHGSLYHATDQKPDLAQAYLDWTANHIPEVLLYLRSEGETSVLAEHRGQAHWQECYLDRTYEADGSLRSRQFPDALITDAAALQQRLADWRDHQAIMAISGEMLHLPCDTFCIHSDSSHALALVKRAKRFFSLPMG